LIATSDFCGVLAVEHRTQIQGGDPVRLVLARLAQRVRECSPWHTQVHEVPHRFVAEPELIIVRDELGAAALDVPDSAVDVHFLFLLHALTGHGHAGKQARVGGAVLAVHQYRPLVPAAFPLPVKH